MFGISGTELLIILFFGFLIFGPDKLPQIGRTVGRAIRQFRDASEAANKKFKEEVADPFQEAIAPYKDQVEESTKPIQDDINAINQTFNETKSMFTDPFKDVFSPSNSTPAKPKAAVTAVGTAVDAKDVADGAAHDAASDADAAAGDTAGLGDDPFAGAIPDAAAKDTAGSDAADDDAAASQEPASEGMSLDDIPEPEAKVKKSLASSLYGLDDDKDGE